MKGQLSYSVWQSLNRIYFSFILLTEPLTDKDRKEPLIIYAPNTTSTCNGSLGRL